jgi:hypothetical protein
LSKFGQALAGAKSSGNGGLASLLGSLTSYGQSVFNSSGQFASAIAAGGIGLYDDGGYTGPGGKFQAAGVVHRGEVVFSQADVARHGGPAAVDAIRLGRRGYADGGIVDGRAGPANSNQPVNVQVNVHNSSGASVDIRRKDTAQGVAIDVMIDDAVASKINTPGSKSRRAMQSQYGLAGGLARR